MSLAFSCWRCWCRSCRNCQLTVPSRHGTHAVRPLCSFTSACWRRDIRSCIVRGRGLTHPSIFRGWRTSPGRKASSPSKGLLATTTATATHATTGGITIINMRLQIEWLRRCRCSAIAHTRLFSTRKFLQERGKLLGLSGSVHCCLVNNERK
jgi:hypothetical protein